MQNHATLIILPAFTRGGAANGSSAVRCLDPLGGEPSRHVDTPGSGRSGGWGAGRIRLAAASGGAGGLLARSAGLRAARSLGGIPLIPAATQAGNIEGTLQLTIGGDGSLENAAFMLVDGTSFPVTGQAIGQQLAIRVALDELRTVVLQGVAEQPLSICQGAVDGSLIGPAEGDLGDFHAIAAGQAVSGAAESAASDTEVFVTPAEASSLPAPSPTSPVPAPSPTAECLPLGPAEVCVYPLCGMQSDGCGGFVDCGHGECDEGFQVCFEGECCNFTEPCFSGMCGQMISCGEIINCPECPDDKFCIENVCCSPPGAQCFVGGECCSGSCSMLNGCN